MIMLEQENVIELYDCWIVMRSTYHSCASLKFFMLKFLFLARRRIATLCKH